MRMGSYFLTKEEENLIMIAIANGAHTIGFYDRDGAFFTIFSKSGADEDYYLSLANGRSHAVARYDGMKDVFLF